MPLAAARVSCYLLIMNDLDSLARRLQAFESADKLPYQRQLRVLQSLWREQCGYAAGTHKDRPLGSRLPMPWARESLANFISDSIRQVVREEVLDPKRSRDKLYGTPRIFSNLLSSQPLAFNLFAIPSRDLDLATRWLRRKTGDEGLVVTAIDFEWSPGRRDPRYTADRSAFDVFVRYTDGHGAEAFLGIEVKYHESMQDSPATLRERYEELAEQIGWFREDCLARLRATPLQQVWRDHLLAASLLTAGDFQRGKFIFLYPRVNTACADVISAYRDCLTNTDGFDAWTIESAVATLREVNAGSWVDDLHDRYLDLAKLDAAMKRG